MKMIFLISTGVTLFLLSSCTSSNLRPAGNVESIERQSPVTQNPNALGDALNAQNAVDYSHGNRNRGLSDRGFGL